MTPTEFLREYGSEAALGAVIAVLVVGMAVGVAVDVAAAQSDDGPIGNLFDGEDDSGTLDQILGGIAGANARVEAWVGLGEDTDAEAAADDTKAAFNDHAADFQQYANDRTDASTDYDVLAFKHRIDGETATVYLTTTVRNGSYEDARMVDSTDRTVDETCTLEGHAAWSADEELDQFHDEYVTANESITRAELARLAAQYKGSVNCSFAMEAA